VTGSPGTAQKTAREIAPNFRSKDLPNHLSIETKFWGDDEHPKERLCPKNYGLKLPTTPEIVNLGQEHNDLGFIQKSTDRRPNPTFEGSISSPKVRKASIHVFLKEIRGETNSNSRNHTKNKGTKTSTKRPRKTQLQIFYTNQEIFTRSSMPP
jgi:hypothetical protein